MRQNIRTALLAVALLVALAACVPQLAGNVLSVTATEAKEATVVFTPGEHATDVELYLGRVTAVLSASQLVECQPVANLGTSCTVPLVIEPLRLTVQAIDPSNISASVWFTTADGDLIARATP